MNFKKIILYLIIIIVIVYVIGFLIPMPTDHFPKPNKNQQGTK